MNGLAHKFWYVAEDAPRVSTYPVGWPKRAEANRRSARIAQWGTIGWDRPAMASKIRAALAQDPRWAKRLAG
jgi:hypothetical protein